MENDNNKKEKTSIEIVNNACDILNKVVEDGHDLDCHIEDALLNLLDYLHVANKDSEEPETDLSIDDCFEKLLKITEDSTESETAGTFINMTTPENIQQLLLYSRWAYNSLKNANDIMKDEAFADEEDLEDVDRMLGEFEGLIRKILDDATS